MKLMLRKKWGEGDNFLHFYSSRKKRLKRFRILKENRFIFCINGFFRGKQKNIHGSFETRHEWKKVKKIWIEDRLVMKPSETKSQKSGLSKKTQPDSYFDSVSTVIGFYWETKVAGLKSKKGLILNLTEGCRQQIIRFLKRPVSCKNANSVNIKRH